MKNIERAKNYQKKLYRALGREWKETDFKKFWEGGVWGNEWDSLYDQGLLENDFCAWCGSNELKSDYFRSPSFSTRGVRVPICDACFMEATGGSVQLQSKPTRGGCFIATAVFGNYSHPSVVLLRNYRDTVLNYHKVGRAFINIYYLLSPPLAKFVAHHYFFRQSIKTIFLNPLIKLISRKDFDT